MVEDTLVWPDTPASPSAGAEPPQRHPDAVPPGEPIPSHYRLCFGCGEGADGGLHMSIEAGRGLSLTARFVVGERHQGAPGLAHGGIITAAFDESLGALGWLLLTPVVTGRLEVDFRRPVPVGSTVVIDGEIVGVSGRKVYTRGVGRLGTEGPVAATGAGLFVMVGREHFDRHGRAQEVAAAAGERAGSP